MNIESVAVAETDELTPEDVDAFIQDRASGMRDHVDFIGCT
jgi:hypothetical protein